MSNNSDDSVDGSAEGSQDAGSDKSFVGKIVSGLISNTPLSKWFGAKDSPAAVRRREEYGDEEEDDSYSLQPPLKRVKRPTLSEIYGGSPMYSSPPAPISSHPSNNLATGMDLEYNHFPRPLAGLTGANNRKVLRPTAASTITSASVPHLEDEVTPAAVLNGETNTDESDEGSTRGSTPVPVESRTERGQQERSPSEASTEPNPFSVTKSLFSSSRASYHRSLFSESGITPRTNRNHNTSLSSRRPVFDAATFSSPKFVDRTLMTEKILKSPFYQGQTTYGGASAYSTNRLTRSASAEKRHAIQIVPVKPKSVSENASLSKTARRIMNSLEEMNTPITDAKKIPVATREERQEGILSRYIGAKPFMLRDGSKRRAASNRELQVPTVPDLIRMKQKQRLQTSTETVRHIATSSKSTLNDSYALPKKRPSEDDDDSNTSRKHTGKTRSSVSLSTRQRAHLQADDTPVEVNLPNVALPITQLPQFDFRPIGGSSSKEKDNEATAVTEVAPAATSGTSSASIASVGTSYSFSKPIVICEAPAAKPLQAINCFRFSQPVSKKPQATPITTTSSFPYSEGGDSTTAAATSRVKSNGENVGGKSPLPAGRSNAGFGDAFKMKGDQWECGACMLRNKTADNACVACSTARPSSGPASTTAGTTPASKQPIANMFGQLQAGRLDVGVRPRASYATPIR